MKRKKLTASMIALVMSVSLPMTTYAANWYLEVKRRYVSTRQFRTDGNAGQRLCRAG